MKATINDRICLLKSESGLSNLEFCHQAKISNGTLHNIQSGENVSPKTIQTICEALNLNKKWLLTGEGAVYNNNPKSPSPAAQDPSSFENAINALKTLLENQLAEKDKQIAGLMNLLNKVNFRKPAQKPGSGRVLKMTSLGTVLADVA